ncbi:MAG: hypothetical protein QME60_01250 [Verrucomicrobiota bacterium]|nr:hypothetical protein [Verrucomicrobiota bacterium]
MIEALLAKIFASKPALFVGGALGGVLLKVFWPRLRSAMGALVKRQTAGAIQSILDKKVDDPILKEKLRKATLANVELVEYLIPDRGQGADKKACVVEALRRVFPGAAADIIADVIEEAVYSSDEVFKGAIK